MAFDGQKAISLADLPDAAWNYLAGKPQDDNGTDVPQVLFKKVPWLYRACMLRAQGLGDIPWALMTGDKTVYDSETADKAPPKGLEWIVNLRELVTRTELALCLYGAAYLFWERNYARTIGYRWLLPTTMIPKIDKDKGLTGFGRRIGGNEMPLTTDDVVYFWYPAVDVEIGPGTAPAQVALQAAGLTSAIDTWTKGFFDRGATPMTLISVEGNPDKAELDRLERWWKKMLQGVKRAWETVAVRASVKPQVIGTVPKDLAMKELTEGKQKDVSVAFGIPFTLLFSEATNKATAGEDNVNFYVKTLIPESELIESVLNQQVFAKAGYELRMQPEKLEVIQQYQVGTAFQLFAFFEGQVITREELRREMGWPEQPEGTTFALPGGANVPMSDARGRDVGAETAAASAAISGKDEAKPQEVVQEKKRWERKALKALAAGQSPNVPFATLEIPLLEQAEIKHALARATSDDEVKAAFAGDPFPFKSADDGEDPARGRLERRHAKLIQDALRRQRDAALPEGTTEATVGGAVERALAASQPLRDALYAMLVDGVMLGTESATLQVEQMQGVAKSAPVIRQDVIRDGTTGQIVQVNRYGLDDQPLTIRTVSRDGGGGIVGIKDVPVGIDVDWTLVNADARAWASQYAGQLIGDLNDTTAHVLRSALAEWVDNSLSYDDLVAEIGDAFGQERAERIAVTEITRSFAHGNVAAWQASGIIAKRQYQTANDENVCKTCGPLNQKVVRMDDTSIPIPQHVRCRCWWKPYVPALTKQGASSGQ